MQLMCLFQMSYTSQIVRRSYHFKILIQKADLFTQNVVIKLINKQLCNQMYDKVTHKAVLINV